MNSLALILLASVLTIGVNAGAIHRLVGAVDAEDGEFPYQVSLRVKGQHFCGGALITKKHVLTAAHCVYPILKQPLLRSLLTVVTGTNSLTSGGDSYKVSDLTYNDKYVDKPYNPDFMYDIGVITLTSEAKLSDSVKIVPLPKAEPEVGAPAVISGWGTMKSPESPASETLKKLTLTIVSQKDCQTKFGRKLQIRESQVCAFKKLGAGTCSGDSGGPLVSEGKIIGVVSGGIACAKGVPDVYTNVHHYLDYIKGITGDAE